MSSANRRNCLVAFGFELHCRWERLCQDLGESAVTGLHGAGTAHVLTEPVPRVGILERCLDALGVLCHPVGEGRRDQGLATREASEQGGHADLGPSGRWAEHRSTPGQSLTLVSGS